MKISMILDRKKMFARVGMLLICFLAWAAVPVMSQSTDNNNDAWSEEEDEDEEVDVITTEEAPVVAKYDDALIHVNGDLVNVVQEYRVKKDDVLNISVRQLEGASPVIIEMKKGGINLNRKVFYANNKGELDLEVKTGNKKVSGDAVLYYTPKGNAKRTLEVKIIVE